MLFFLIGLILLLIGSKGVINNAIKISLLTKIPTFLIGVTLVAIGTSLPEIMVSFLGGIDKANNLALGNIIGSNIANIGLIFGISLLIKPIFIDKKDTIFDLFIMFFVSSILFLTLFIDGISFYAGLGFIVFGIGFVTWQVIQGRHERIYLTQKITNRKPFVISLTFIVSIIFLFLGAKLLVDNGLLLAQSLQISPIILGVVAVAIGTSLPELAVSISALTHHATKNKEKIVLGNIMGSNIFNIFFGVGILGLFGIRNFNNNLSLYTFLGFTFVFCLVVIIYRGKLIPRWIGALLLLSYSLYIFFLLK